MHDIFDDIPDQYDDNKANEAIEQLETKNYLTKKQRREAAVQSNTVCKFDYIDEFNFTCTNVKTARELLISNKLEFLKWALMKATTESYTPLGEKLATILAKEFVSDANSIERANKDREGEDPYEGLKVSVMKRVFDGTLRIEDVKASDYDNYEIQEAEVVETEQQANDTGIVGTWDRQDMSRKSSAKEGK